MTRHVLVLGAGASVDCGGPVMRNFLNIAEDLSRDAPPRVDVDAFRRVLEGVHHLRRAQSNAQLDLGNIETVLAAFEMAALLGWLGDMPPPEVAKLPESMRTLIVQTIECTIRYTTDIAGGLRPPSTYARLALIAREALRRNTPLTIITFNYDVALDFALQYCRAEPEYCLASGASPRGVRLLKLHGSLNWTLASSGIVAMPWEEVLHGMRWSAASDNAYLSMSGALRRFQRGNGQAVIVPPTWSKLPAYQAIAPVWRRAAEELRDAEHIYIAGFSLAASDEFFRMLYGIGTAGRSRLRTFAVYDPAIESVGERFRGLLGQAALPHFRPHQHPFSRLVHDLQAELGLGPLNFAD